MIENELLERQMNRMTKEKKNLFLNIREWVLNLGNDIHEKITEDMICYYRQDYGFIWFDVPSKKVRIYLKKGSYHNPATRLIPESWGGYPEIRLGNDEINIDHIKELLTQAYRQ